MKLISVVIALLSLVTNGCCVRKERAEPSHPGIIPQWVARKESGVHILGTFVLKSGDTSDNGKVQVKVVGLIAGNSCAEYGSYAQQDKVRLQFIDLINKKVVCEETYVQGGSTTLFSGPCASLPNDFGIAAVYIKAVNIKDGWVYFELGG